MSAKKQNSLKSNLHPRNKNRERYDLNALVNLKPELETHVFLNKYGIKSIDFSNPAAVKLLNQALLHQYYGIENWDFPDKNLCPPIPGRVDYLHHIADLLSLSNSNSIPQGDLVKVLDIGTGASCIYPILGVAEYGWKFTASDIDKKSIQSAQAILNANPALNKLIELRWQENDNTILKGIIKKEDKIDVTVSNPPFHSSIEEAEKAARRKVKNLSGKKNTKVSLNFAGNHNELIYKGGEYAFIKNMIDDSVLYKRNILWFTSLVSKESNLKRVYQLLENVKVEQVKTIPMGTGNKSSRIIAWSFLTGAEQREWSTARWS